MATDWTIDQVFPGGRLPFKPVPFERPLPQLKREKRPKRVVASDPPFKEWRKAHRAKKAGAQ